MPGYATAGCRRRRNPYRIIPSKKGRDKRERMQPHRRLMRIKMAIKRFEARHPFVLPERHWEQCDLPDSRAERAVNLIEAAMSEYARQRRDNLERLLLAIQEEAARAAKEKAERDELERVMRANGMSLSGRKLRGWKK